MAATARRAATAVQSERNNALKRAEYMLPDPALTCAEVDVKTTKSFLILLFSFLIPQCLGPESNSKKSNAGFLLLTRS
jgi:hypothetical protein